MKAAKKTQMVMMIDDDDDYTIFKAHTRTPKEHALNYAYKNKTCTDHMSIWGTPEESGVGRDVRPPQSASYQPPSCDRESEHGH